MSEGLQLPGICCSGTKSRFLTAKAVRNDSLVLDPLQRLSMAASNYAPNAFLIAPAMPSVSAFIFSSDSASTITRASVSVPE
jgi:hypothetical protein